MEAAEHVQDPAPSRLRTACEAGEKPSPPVALSRPAPPAHGPQPRAAQPVPPWAPSATSWPRRASLKWKRPSSPSRPPEGARDYLVPFASEPRPVLRVAACRRSSIKQFCMISSRLDRYFQIARCFRDEDLRAPTVSRKIHSSVGHRNELRRRETGHGYGRRPHDPRVQGSARRGHSRSVPPA